MVTKNSGFYGVFWTISLVCGTIYGGDDKPSSLVNAVQKRYYVIHRLEGAVERLMKGYQRICHHCSSPLEKEFKTVQALWHSCITYRSIMNDAQTRELSTHLVVLYEALLKACGSCPANLSIVRQSSKDVLADIDLLDAAGKGMFDKINPQLASEIMFNEEAQPASLAARDAEPDDHFFEGLDDTYKKGDFVVNTVVRFYVIKRIFDAMKTLKKIGACGEDRWRTMLPLLATMDNRSTAARECIDRLRKEQTLEPLETFWDAMISYRYIGDSHVIRECLIIMVHLYQVFIKYVAPSVAPSEPASSEQIMDLYTSISSLPLPELLLLIDELTEQSTALISVYHEGKQQGWQALCKQYWWVPPIAIVGCASLYLRVKKLLGHATFRTEMLAHSHG